ncbi:MAG: HAD family phosphatase [Clostridia bacterium]|nr:HAD family phosphatase [Clostridia bacterium]
MNITGAIFDFDGTLFDSMPIWKGLKFEFLKNIGVELTEQDKKDISGLFLMDAIPLAKERFNLKESVEELLSMFFELLKDKYLEKAVPKNDIIPFLEKLKAKGVKMGIATATGEAALIPLLEKFNMLHYFTSIYSTYTVGASKAYPKVYDVVREELGVDIKTTWVFEDAIYAVKTAKTNGYNVVGIFDESQRNPNEVKEIADIFINNYSEIDL